MLIDAASLRETSYTRTAGRTWPRPAYLQPCVTYSKLLKPQRPLSRSRHSTFRRLCPRTSRAFWTVAHHLHSSSIHFIVLASPTGSTPTTTFRQFQSPEYIASFFEKTIGVLGVFDPCAASRSTSTGKLIVKVAQPRLGDRLHHVSVNLQDAGKTRRCPRRGALLSVSWVRPWLCTESH